ncbi:MAG: DNA-3-methyladenine glycosylase I [Actinomycetes bacterium]
MADTGVVPGPDGVLRCPWALTGSPVAYRDYHDHEWGRVVHGDAALFERLVLEGFQAGLSWATILAKRGAFRNVFAGFDPVRVAGFTAADQDRIAADPGIVRNRAKIAAAVGNARLVVDLGVGGLDGLLWSFAPPPAPAPVTTADVPAVTAASAALAADLRARGFRFVGPTTCYALMQAVGMVDDHLAGCSARRPC